MTLKPWTSPSAFASPTLFDSNLTYHAINTFSTKRSFNRYQTTYLHTPTPPSSMRIHSLCAGLLLLLTSASANPADDLRSIQLAGENASNVLNASSNSTTPVVSHATLQRFNRLTAARTLRASYRTSSSRLVQRRRT